MSEETPTPGRKITGSDPERINRLIDQAVQLTNEIEDLAEASGTQFVSLAKASRTNRRLIFGVIAGGLLDIILTIVMGFVGVGVVQNTDRIDAITQQLNADNTEQRKRALCPLYGVFLDSQSEEGRKRAPDPEKYDHAFEVIGEGYKVLGCDKYLDETGRDAW